VLTITEGAEEALAILRDSVDDLPEGGGMRISQETDEEGQAAFSLQLVEEPEADDVVIEARALPIYVEPAAAQALDGTALDGEAHEDHVHFGFVAMGGSPSSNGNGPGV
jgi:Fe-S cluster assembly iron-binding protein IscA